MDPYSVTPHYDKKNRTPPHQKGWEPHPDREEWLRGYGQGWDDSGEFQRSRFMDVWPLLKLYENNG